MAHPGPGPRASAADTAYTVTKELILSGQLPGGTLISEGEIAERTHLSRTPVREAFLRLEGENLLRLHPKRGAVVVPVLPGEAEDVLELRQALERAAVTRIGRRGLAGSAERHLRELIARQREHADAADVESFAAADEAFHRGIVEASGNALSGRFYATLADRQRRMGAYALRPRPERLAVVADEHARLLELVVAGDPEGFAEALHAHLTGTHGTASAS